MKLKSLSILLVVSMLVATMVGCQTRTEDADTSSGASGSGETVIEEGKTVSSIVKDFTTDVKEHYEQNDDTVGWIFVPGTNIEDVIVQKKDDTKNTYYERLDFNENYDFNGVYYADYRSVIGNTAAEMGVNTCVYGHSMTDDPLDEQYNVKFANLHDFQDPELAKTMPYIQISTPEENLVYEVFAVFMGNCDNPAFSYNHNPSGEEFLKTIQEEVLPRSIYNYDVEVNKDDKFLTLSTCLYKLPDGRELDYKTTYFRYAIMAKLVSPDEPLKSQTSFTINEDLKLDPDGKWEKAAA